MDIGFMSCFEPEYFPNFQTFSFRSEQTLLDFDLLFWNHEFLHFDYRIKTEDEPTDLARLLKDRNRRLHEIDTFLERGKTLILLLTTPVHISINDPVWRDVEMIHMLSKTKIGRKALEKRRKESKQLIDKQNKILSEYGFSRDEFDTYSFLPDYIETLMRSTSVPLNENSNSIDFRGDSAFLAFWDCLRGKTWYDIFFSSPVGNPLLYRAGTRYPVSIWLKKGNGNIVLLPHTEYDTSDDYPIFVEAGKHLLSALDNQTNDYVEVLWAKQSDSFPDSYVDPKRLEELRVLSNHNFDLSKLVRLCEELNICYENGCFFAVTMIVRTIMNHVPPVFGYNTFTEVANNYGGQSFKKSMQNLNSSLKNIADANLHLTVRSREVLPTRVQVNFSHDLDQLLSEVIRVV